jgi:hypothetical protein
MRCAQWIVVGVVMCCATPVFPAEPPPAVVGAQGVLLAADDFDRSDIAPWVSVIPTFEIEQGVLVGRQTRDDHGAVGRLHQQFGDVAVALKFKLEGSSTFNVVFDDKGFRGSHAGHIARVAIAPTQVRLGDDKDGAMRNDIYELRRDPARKAEGDKLLAGRGLIVKHTTDQNRWYDLVIAIRGDRMQVWLDGAEIGRLQSPGLAHPTKSSLHFTVNGTRALFDDVRVWRLDETGR